jgi:hypothetical protein
MEIPEAPGGSCCLKPVITQSKHSKRMYIIAQHIQYLFKDRVELVIPSKSESRILLVKKYKQFLADWRKRRMGIRTLPALVLDGKVLCQGAEHDEVAVEKKAKEILSN